MMSLSLLGIPARMNVHFDRYTQQWGRDDDLARPDMLFDVYDTNTYFMIKSDFTERELQRALDDFYAH